MPEKHPGGSETQTGDSKSANPTFYQLSYPSPLSKTINKTEERVEASGRSKVYWFIIKYRDLHVTPVKGEGIIDSYQLIGASIIFTKVICSHL